ncbi:hypothetical protein ACVWXO_004212 [Bradyrhizobium sp. LM2.7]
MPPLAAHVIGTGRPPPEFNSPLAVLLHELVQANHGRHSCFTIVRTFSRHQRTAGAAGLRRHPVRLCGQPFPQPRARQCVGRCHGGWGLLSHRVLAVPAGRDHVLRRRADPYGARRVRAVSTPAVPVEDDRAAPIGAGAEHPRSRHGACDRRAARPHVVWARQALSAGALSVLRRIARPALADDDPARHRLGSRLHRNLFLASPEAVLHARRTLSARGGRADPDAGAAWHLSGRTQRRGRKRRRRMAHAQSDAPPGRHSRGGRHAGSASPAALPSAISACSDWRCRRAACGPIASGAAV